MPLIATAMRFPGPAAALFVAAACGGRASLVAGAPSDASTGAAPDGGSGLADGGWLDAAPTCQPDGVRLCGGICGAAPSCPVCTPLQSGTGASGPYGICWADLADDGSTPCALCDSGQGCVQRSPGKYVCVPLDVCGALRALGAQDVCWYGDKVPFDGAPVLHASGCPDSSGDEVSTTGLVCGGDCPPCGNQYTLPRCVGQGPDHPFGICPAIANAGAWGDLGHFPTCALARDGYSAACPDVAYSYPLACAVSPYPPGDPVVAGLNGFCLGVDFCASLASSLPGGLWCFDSSGTRIAP